jgi:transposase
VITASEPSWTALFAGLSPRQFGKLITALRREGADRACKGWLWSLPLEDRVLLVAAYWRTNLTLRQLAPLFGVSKSAADRIIDHLGPSLALQQRKRFRKGTVLIVDGTLVPTRDHIIAEQSHGFDDEFQGWTLKRVKLLIWRMFPIGYTIQGVWKRLRRYGWSAQVPLRRAAERDEEAIQGVFRKSCAVPAVPAVSGACSRRAGRKHTPGQAQRESRHGDGTARVLLLARRGRAPAPG